MDALCTNREYRVPDHFCSHLSNRNVLYSCIPDSCDLGAGSYPGGKYSMVCFEVAGMGQFLPGEGAVPNIGTAGQLAKVPETRVEVLCVGKDVMTGAVDSLKR